MQPPLSNSLRETISSIAGHDVVVLWRARGAGEGLVLLWTDGTPESEMREIVSQLWRERGITAQLTLRRELSPATQIQLVTWAGTEHPELLDRLSAAAEIPAAPQERALSTKRFLETCSLRMRGCASTELTTPLEVPAAVRELASIIRACSPEVESDLTQLPAALERAHQVLAQV